jgi:hypothetical protein
MSDITISYTEPTSEAEYQAAMQSLIAEISRMNAEMHQEQDRIVRLKIETEALRGETQRLRTETRAALARMGEPV